MSNPTLRKPPAKRAYHGVAGSPLARIAEIDGLPATMPVVSSIISGIPVGEPEPPSRNPDVMKPGPGQPRKHDSNAAKQAAYRERQKTAERDALIDKLLRLYDSRQDKIMEFRKDGKRYSAKTIAEREAVNRQQKREYRQSLDQMTIEQLQNELALNESHNDLGGKSGLENQVRKGNIARVSDQMQGREHVITGWSDAGPVAVERWLDNAVEDMLLSHDSPRCPMCDLEFPSTTADWSRADMSEHLWRMFRVGEKQHEQWRLSRDAILDHNTNNPEHGIPIEPLRTTEFDHYRRLWKEIKRVRKLKRKSNIVTTTVIECR
jgi:hypothetical protein